MGTAAVDPPRIVVDCNVVVSALVFRGSTSRLVDFWEAGSFQFLASKEMIEELARVLAYPKFGLGYEDIRQLLNKHVLPFIEPVLIANIPEVSIEDPSDNIYLACAGDGHADYLVTGDKHLLKIHSYQDIPIITAAEFLDHVMGEHNA